MAGRIRIPQMDLLLNFTGDDHLHLHSVHPEDGDFRWSHLQHLDPISPTTPAPSAVVAGDVDGDGIDEAVAYFASDDRLVVAKVLTDESGHASFTVISSLSAPLGSCAGFQSMCVGDIDADGQDELLLKCNNWGGIFAFKFVVNPETHHREWRLLGGFGSDTVDWVDVACRFLTADIDGDGRDEVLVVVPGDPTIEVFRWRGLAAGGPRWIQLPGIVTPNDPSYLEPAQVFAGDFDADGRREIAVYLEGSSGSGPRGFIRWLCVYDWDESTPSWSELPHLTFTSGGDWADRLRLGVAGDFDGDGVHSLALNTCRNDHVVIHRFDGQQWLASPECDVIGGTVPTPRFLLAGDLDGDGRDELLVNFTDDDHFHPRRFDRAAGAWSSAAFLDPIGNAIPTPRFAVLGDFLGRGFAARPTTRAVEYGEFKQLIGVVKAPPKHPAMGRDVLRATFAHKTQRTEMLKVKISSTWTLQASASGDFTRFFTFGAKLSAKVTTTSEEEASQSLSVLDEAVIEADARDRRISLIVPCAVREYEVLNPRRADGTNATIFRIDPTGPGRQVFEAGDPFVDPSHAPHALSELGVPDSTLIIDFGKEYQILIGDEDSSQFGITIERAVTREVTTTLGVEGSLELTAGVATVSVAYGRTLAATGSLTLATSSDFRIEYEGLPTPLSAEERYVLRPVVYVDAANGHFVFTHVVPLPRRLVGNTRSLELHVVGCTYERAMSPWHRREFASIAAAQAAGYNGCYYCLHEIDTG